MMTRAAVVTLMLSIAAAPLSAQDADPLPTTKDSSKAYPNTTAGEFTPARGFDIFSTQNASLNISFYGLFRYTDQLPAELTYNDHLGRPVNATYRNDLNWHRTMIWLTGFFYDQRFRYNITSWSLPTTQQTLIFGNLQFFANKHFGLIVGILPTLTARSLQGSWPFWAGSDRQMVEELFRGGFSSGFGVNGEIVRTLTYSLNINNNLSQLGTTQSNDTRNMAFSGSLRWQPTTGEFGPRNGFGDFEHHTRLATQFGTSAAHARESRYAPLDQAPNATQIKLTDGLNPFAANALADGVTVQTLTYREMAIDAGAKLRGLSINGEYYFRKLDDFVATGPLPISEIFDHGFMAQASYMVVPRTVNLYASGGYISDDFGKYPWEAGGGINFYPSKTRSLRLNAHVMHVHHNPSSSFFGYYLAGLTGTVFSLGTDILM